MLFTFFPHGTGSLSVTREYLALGDGPPDSDGISRVPPYSGSTQRERSFDYRAVTSYGGPFQTSSSTSFFCNSVQSVLQPQEASLLVWANPVSLAATQGIAFAFSSSGYLDVSVPRYCLLISYEFRYGYHSITSGGFPHSEISGSKLAYSSPKHIGVRPVLHRLLVPRHPPCALSNLTVKESLCDILSY